MLIFDVRRFSTHDGPGIRTTVFLKNCPLRCLWCQNPEGISAERRLFYFQDKCIGCGTCIAACPEKAIIKTGAKITIDRSACNLCGACVEVCPPEALNFDSRLMTVREVVDEILRDRMYYTESGGVTLSGGDPTARADFAVNILKACRYHGIHTAIETSLYTRPETLARILPELNLLIADFKVFDPEQHRAWTGVSQELILENFDEVFKNWFNQGRLDMLVRIPLIPGYTATTENIRAIGEYCISRAPRIRMELLNYNPLAKGKYTQLDQPFIFDKNPRMFTPTEMENFNLILKNLGISVVTTDL